MKTSIFLGLMATTLALAGALAPSAFALTQTANPSNDNTNDQTNTQTSTQTATAATIAFNLNIPTATITNSGSVGNIMDHICGCGIGDIMNHKSGDHKGNDMMKHNEVMGGNVMDHNCGCGDHKSGDHKGNDMMKHNEVMGGNNNNHKADHNCGCGDHKGDHTGVMSGDNMNHKSGDHKGNDNWLTSGNGGSDNGLNLGIVSQNANQHADATTQQDQQSVQKAANVNFSAQSNEVSQAAVCVLINDCSG